MTLQEMLLVLMRRWKLIVLGAVFTGAVALGISFLTPPTYEAVATVAMARTTVTVNFDPRVKLTPEEEAMFLLRQRQDVEARRKALVALVQNAAIAQRVLEQLRDRLPEKLQEPGVLLKQVEGGSNGDAIQIRVKGSDPELAAELANAWATEYEKHINGVYGNTAAVGMENVQRETERVKGEYEQTQRALEAFLAENRMNEITRQIEEKKAIVSSLLQGKKDAIEAVVNAQVQARSEIVSTYIRTQLENFIHPFKKEQEDRIARLAQDYALRRQLEELLESARALRSQVSAGNSKTAAVTSTLPILLMKMQAFALTTGLPEGMNLSLPTLVTTLQTEQTVDRLLRSSTGTPSAQDMKELVTALSQRRLPSDIEINVTLQDASVDPQEQIKDLDALVAALEQQSERLTSSIAQHSQELMENRGYQFLNADIALQPQAQGQQAADGEALLARVTEEVSKQLLQLQGLEEIPNYTAAAAPITQAIVKLEDEIDAFEAQLEAEQARKKELVRARDLAWEKYNALAAKVAEVDVASSITGTEVRFAAPALAPSEPVAPKKLMNGILGGFVGLMFALGLVLISEHPAIKGLQLDAETAEKTHSDPSS